MITAPQFADAVGRKNIAVALEVGATAVSNAVVRGRFPASWFETCQVLAEEAGVECPGYLFGQKGVHSTQRVNADPAFQESRA